MHPFELAGVPPVHVPPSATIARPSRDRFASSRPALQRKRSSILVSAPLRHLSSKRPCRRRSHRHCVQSVGRCILIQDAHRRTFAGYPAELTLRCRADLECGPRDDRTVRIDSVLRSPKYAACPPVLYRVRRLRPDCEPRLVLCSQDLLASPRPQIFLNFL